jgi:phage shock protein C
MAGYCHRCGTGLPPGARFCTVCGTAVPMGPGVVNRPLVRPRVGRHIAGVCLGLSRAYGWQVGVVRLLAVLALVLSSGLVGIAYLAAWVGIPEEPFEQPGAQSGQPGAPSGQPGAYQ